MLLSNIKIYSNALKASSPRGSASDSLVGTDRLLTPILDTINSDVSRDITSSINCLHVNYANRKTKTRHLKPSNDITTTLVVC